uniref:Small ribosomal subunit protein mS31 n=1 Tax=Salarias fasciatus TaxID=181472 RepID=A0A672FRZ5_SALFA
MTNSNISLNVTSSIQKCQEDECFCFPLPGFDAPSIHNETTDSEKKGDSVNTDQPKMTEQQEEPMVLKAVDESATAQQVEDKKEEIVMKQTQVKTEAVKSGKENLLDLLGAMKVEVTSKRKLKSLRITQTPVASAQQKSKPAMESTISMFQQATGEASLNSESLDPSLVSAASAAASTLPNQKKAESELLKQLLKRKAMADAQKKGDVNDLGEIIADMKVGRSPNRQNTSPAGQILFDDDGRGYMPTRGITSELASVQRRRSLFSGKRLGIFSPPTDEDAPTLWDVDFAHQLSLSTNQLPRNGIEEMIQWTKEGKMWLYPIDNEAGLEEEASVPFHEHIFLEKHLEEGFPRQGPVRHFMELVVAGLSKNPYLTVQQKKEHISWFRDYFNQKEEVLKEADVYLN